MPGGAVVTWSVGAPVVNPLAAADGRNPNGAVRTLASASERRVISGLSLSFGVFDGVHLNGKGYLAC